MHDIKWPFINLNISSLFIWSYFVLYLSTFSNFNFSCFLTAARWPECCLYLATLTLITNFLFFFLFLQLRHFSFMIGTLLIVDAFIKSIPYNYCLDVVLGICQICCLGSVILYFAFLNYVASIQYLMFILIHSYSSVCILYSVIMSPRFHV